MTQFDAGGVVPGAHATTPQVTSPAAQETRNLGEILGDVTAGLSDLMRQEVQLAKVELKDEAAKTVKGAGLFGGAAVTAHLVLVWIGLTVMFALDTFMPLVLAALVTTVIWAAVAGLLALLGRAQLKKANPQLPKTQQTLQEDAQWVKAQKN